MMKKYFKVGDVVRYSKDWCEPSEQYLISVVVEDVSHDDEDFNRYVIANINGRKFLGMNHIENVSDYMIELIEAK